MEGRIITAEPRLKRDEDDDTSSSMKAIVCASEGMIGSAAHIILS